jgi:acetyl esterase/lipase
VRAIHRFGAGPDGYGELWLPLGGGPHPVAVLIHGGFWRSAYGLDLMDGLAADLQARGVAAWNLEYRRLGGGGGWPATFIDVAAGVDRLTTIAAGQRLDVSRMVVAGHSAGGHLALWTAARATLPAGAPGASPPLRPRLAVALAGVCDLAVAAERGLGGGAAVELMGAPPEAAPDAYALASPAARLPLGVPQLLVHGTADDCVPVDMSERYQAAATAAGDRCRLIRLPGVDHYAPIDPGSDAWRLTADEVGAALG